MELNPFTGIVDLDVKMIDKEKDVKIAMKTLNEFQTILAMMEIRKTLPKPQKVKSMFFNDVLYSKNIGMVF